jgi:Domain of unknown function (DUF4145)
LPPGRAPCLACKMHHVPGQHVVTWDDQTPQSVSITCGYCGRDVQAERISKAVELERSNFAAGWTAMEVVVGATFVCGNHKCRGPSVVFMEFMYDMGDTSHEKIVGQLPRGKATAMEGLPEPLERVRSEAWSCYYGGDHRAAVVMGRAAVQRAVRTLGGEGRDLFHEIDSLYARGVVTEELKEWAHDVRLAQRRRRTPRNLEKCLRPRRLRASSSLTISSVSPWPCPPCAKPERPSARQLPSRPGSASPARTHRTRPMSPRHAGRPPHRRAPRGAAGQSRSTGRPRQHRRR